MDIPPVNIRISIYSIIITTILTILVLYVWKPRFVVDQTVKKKILWGKLVSVSLVLGILVGIVLFMWAPKVQIPIQKEEKTKPLPVSNSY